MGAGRLGGWEVWTPFAAETVGQHLENRLFLGMGEEESAVELEQSRGSKEGEYTV